MVLPKASDSDWAMAFASSWPKTAGTYYLVADIQAADDVTSALAPT